MSDRELLEVGRELLACAGVKSRDLALEPLSGGANNRVFRLRSAGGSHLLKQYWQAPGDRDRLTAEFEFARFAQALGASPAALARADDVALFEFVEGRPAARADLTPEAVNQAADFAAGLVRLSREGGQALPLAAEACFSIRGHLDLIEGRVRKLAREAVDSACLQLVHTRLAPAWASVRATVEASAARLDVELPREGRFVSPSDFGFHNALVGEGGSLRFIDFEYAGWDDPAKLVADFFCQPALPVPESHLPAFASRALAPLDDPDTAEWRARLLLPCYRVKWVCIMLNGFLPTGHRRRAFARGEKTAAADRQRQLELAGAALSEVEAATKPG